MFDNKEHSLLNKSLKYSLHFKNKSWIQSLALEPLTAISQLQFIDYSYIRYLVSEQLNDLTKKEIIPNMGKYPKIWQLNKNIK